MDLDTIALEFFERVIGSEVCGNTVKSAAVHDARTRPRGGGVMRVSHRAHERRLAGEIDVVRAFFRAHAHELGAKVLRPSAAEVAAALDLRAQGYAGDKLAPADRWIIVVANR